MKIIAARQLAARLERSHRPGRNRTCSPRFWSPLLATPALQHLVIFNDLALGRQRRRCWTTPALALILALTPPSVCAPTLVPSVDVWEPAIWIDDYTNNLRCVQKARGDIALTSQPELYRDDRSLVAAISPRHIKHDR